MILIEIFTKYFPERVKLVLADYLKCYLRLNIRATKLSRFIWFED